MPAIPPFEITKDFFGRRVVKYSCASCGEQLRSPLIEVGKLDHCPTCRRGFTVPGREFLEQSAIEEQAAQTLALKEKADRLQAMRVQEAEREAARAAALEAAALARRERARLEEQTRLREGAVVVPPPLVTPPVVTVTVGPKRKPRRNQWAASGVVITLLATFALFSFMRGAGLRSKLDRCATQSIVNARVSYSGFFGTDTVIFDCRDSEFGSGVRRIDPVHLLMQFANQLELPAIDRVILAHNGQPRFYISGPDLRRLADSYAGGGRIWAFNNLPASVRRLDGTRAFGEWTGGFLGVLKEQAEDVDEFIAHWIG